MRICYRFSTGVTEAGKLFDGFVAVLILLNVVAVIAESEPSLGGTGGPSEGRFQTFFDGFEVSTQHRRGSKPCTSMWSVLAHGARASDVVLVVAVVLVVVMVEGCV